MTASEKQKSAEDFVRRALAHTGCSPDEKKVKQAARKVAEAMPPYETATA